MPVFGVLYNVSRGHVVSVILLAMVAMLLTSISYGRMARAYPHGGSAFLYVGKEIHPSLGYLTGWCLILDYIVNPLICTIWCSHAAMNFLPAIPYAAWAVFFALFFTGLNCNGVETSARINAGMAAALGIVVVLVLVSAARWVLHLSHPGMAFFVQPFYDPSTFSAGGLLRGTSIAVLTYIGFDGISMLTDEAKNPARSVPAPSCLPASSPACWPASRCMRRNSSGRAAWPSPTSIPPMSTSPAAWVDPFCS